MTRNENGDHETPGESEVAALKLEIARLHLLVGEIVGNIDTQIEGLERTKRRALKELGDYDQGAPRWVETGA